MYKFIGYLVKNPNGDPVNYSPSRPQAEQFCQQHNLPATGVTQIFEWKPQPVIEVAADPESDDSYPYIEP